MKNRDATEPIECPACAGEACHEIPARRMGVRPHWSEATRFEEVPCPDCKGTGEIRCIGCDSPAVRMVEDAPYCAPCGEHWARRIAVMLPEHARVSA